MVILNGLENIRDCIPKKLYNNADHIFAFS